MDPGLLSRDVLGRLAAAEGLGRDALMAKALSPTISWPCRKSAGSLPIPLHRLGATRPLLWRNPGKSSYIKSLAR